MRAAVSLAVLLCAWYVAAAYRSVPLIALCAAEAVTAALMLGLCWYFRARVRVWFPAKAASAVRGETAEVPVSYQNRSGLPVPRLELWVRSQWTWDRRSFSRQLTGGLEPGSGSLSFTVTASHCGVLRLELDRVRVGDYLSLFTASRRTRDNLRLTVYPHAPPLRIQPDFLLREGGVTFAERPGEDSAEILKLREYRPGDPMRRIHWNQTARTDQLWVKEFAREADSRVCLLLDTAGLAGAAVTDADAFYTLLWALLRGLLRLPATVHVWWTDGEDIAEGDVWDEPSCRELLFRLYQASDAPKEQGTVQGRRRLRADSRQREDRRRKEPSVLRPDSHTVFRRLLERVPPGEPCLGLTAGLDLYGQDRLAMRFYPDRLEQQIRTADVRL